jgi:hypothetical protein
MCEQSNFVPILYFCFAGGRRAPHPAPRRLRGAAAPCVRGVGAADGRPQTEWTISDTDWLQQFLHTVFTELKGSPP